MLHATLSSLKYVITNIYKAKSYLKADLEATLGKSAETIGTVIVESFIIQREMAAECPLNMIGRHLERKIRS